MSSTESEMYVPKTGCKIFFAESVVSNLIYKKNITGDIPCTSLN